MIYKIEIPEMLLKKSLRKIPTSDAKKIISEIDSLEQDPRPSGAKKLKGSIKKPLYRIRVGDYRVVYSIFDNILTILIIEIGHRKDIYSN